MSGGRGGAGKGRRLGVTLMELLAVIAIMVLLMAMLFPAAKRLREDARYRDCVSNLHRIGTALRLYKMDEGGYPVRTALDTGNTDLDDLHGRGLIALFDADYLQTDRVLICDDDLDAPNQLEDKSGVIGTPDWLESGAHPEFNRCNRYSSYMAADPDAFAAAPFGQVKYCSFHYASSADPDYQRQLQRADDATTPTGPASYNRDWWPRDDAIVTWCDLHTPFQERDGEPQYVALFVDGTVTRGDAAYFRTNVVRPETWRLRRSDMPDF